MVLKNNPRIANSDLLYADDSDVMRISDNERTRNKDKDVCSKTSRQDNGFVG